MESTAEDYFSARQNHEDFVVKREFSLIVSLGFLSLSLFITGCGQDVPILPQPQIPFSIIPTVGIGTQKAPQTNYPLNGVIYTQARPIGENLMCNNASLLSPVYNIAAFGFEYMRGEFVVQHLIQQNYYYGISFQILRYDGINDGSNETGSVTLTNFQSPVCKVAGSSAYTNSAFSGGFSIVDCTATPFLSQLNTRYLDPLRQIVYNYVVSPGVTVKLTSPNDPYLLCGINSFQNISTSALLTNVQPETWFSAFFNFK